VPRIRPNPSPFSSAPILSNGTSKLSLDCPDLLLRYAFRRASDHILLTTLAASALPHALKRVFDQQRPDRLTALGHLRGIPLSGKRLDAFPSGHAVHIGALASAATVLPTAQRNTLWAVGSGLVLTRIVLLAHWASDVVVGLAVGAALERLLRFVTGFGRR
jgi:membrane-associated phospholipid phosphatase